MKKQVSAFLLIVGISIASDTISQQTFQPIIRTDLIHQSGVKLLKQTLPYGNGSRWMELEIDKGTTALGDIEIWIIYSEQQNAVRNSQLNDTRVSRGRAQIEDIGNNKLKCRFIFPHTRHPTPNITDRNRTVITHGKRVYFKLVRRDKDSISGESIVSSFTMPKKLFVSLMGDSYASGEGAPDKSEVKWINTQCHRSKNSGHLKAVERLQGDFKEIAFDILNTTCSGASVFDGIVGHQSESGGIFRNRLGNNITPQIVRVTNHMRRNNYDQVDIILISVGGNDIGFSEIALKYFYTPTANLINDLPARSNIQNRRLNGVLPNNYKVMKQAFDAVGYQDVFITEYPDLTRNKNGNFCKQILFAMEVVYGPCWGHLENSNSEAEFEYASNQIISKLNKKIRSLTNEFGTSWHYISGPYLNSRKMGLCNCGGYFNTLRDSSLNQGDMKGTLHPNENGYSKLYVDNIVRSLKPEVEDIIKENKKLSQASDERRLEAEKKANARLVFLKNSAKIQRYERIFPGILAHQININEADENE